MQEASHKVEELEESTDRNVIIEPIDVKINDTLSELLARGVDLMMRHQSIHRDATTR